MRSRPTEELRVLNSAVENLDKSSGSCLSNPVPMETAGLMRVGGSSAPDESAAWSGIVKAR